MVANWLGNRCRSWDSIPRSGPLYRLIRIRLHRCVKCRSTALPEWISTSTDFHSPPSSPSLPPPFPTRQIDRSLLSFPIGISLLCRLRLRLAGRKPAIFRNGESFQRFKEDESQIDVTGWLCCNFQSIVSARFLPPWNVVGTAHSVPYDIASYKIHCLGIFQYFPVFMFVI